MLEVLEEMASLAVPDTPDRKVREDTRDAPACPLHTSEQSLQRKENPEPPEAAAFLASPDPEVTRVCQVCPVVRVCLDFLVTPSRVKDSQDSLVTRGNRGRQGSQGRRVKLGSWASPACPDPGATTAHLVSLATPENSVAPVPKVHLEKVMVILEVQELKVSQEMQVSQVAGPTTAPPATAASREVQDTLERRELLVKEGDPG